MDDSYKRKILTEEYPENKITTLDDFYSYTQHTGSLAQAGSDTLYGINQSKAMGSIPVNRDTQGFVFFTRPMLNLSKYNLARKSEFLTLLNNNPSSVQRYIRSTLDPSLATYGNPKVNSNLVDDKMVFIPLLTNTLLKLSGWPDRVSPTFTSKEGIRKEQWSIVDGVSEVNASFDMDATFRSIADEPTTLLLSAWSQYTSAVFSGELKPYAGFEVRNEIDYTTRIYRLILDKTERFVKKIACTVASFPINDPTGRFFDYDRTIQYMDQHKELNIRFRCMGAVYNDPVIMKWFNTAAGYANPSLSRVVNSGFNSNAREHDYIPIPHQLLPKFKNRGYPLINTKTNELQWWISKGSKTYNNFMKIYGEEYTKNLKDSESVII